MSYYFSTEIKNRSFEEAKELITSKLQTEGFGVLSEIDMQGAFKNKLGLDFKKYTILGACNPQLAIKAIKEEDKLGVLLPCNIVVEEDEPGTVEVSIVNPVASLGNIQNDKVLNMAKEVQQKLKRVLELLS